MPEACKFLILVLQTLTWSLYFQAGLGETHEEPESSFEPTDSVKAVGFAPDALGLVKGMLSFKGYFITWFIS